MKESNELKRINSKTYRINDEKKLRIDYKTNNVMRYIYIYGCRRLYKHGQKL